MMPSPTTLAILALLILPGTGKSSLFTSPPSSPLIAICPAHTLSICHNPHHRILREILHELKAAARPSTLASRQDQQQLPPPTPPEVANLSFPSSYVPILGPCPANGSAALIRTGADVGGLAPEEADWVAGRDRVVPSAWEAYLESAGLDKMTLPAGGRWPRVAIAASGGGYRAMMSGASILATFDARVPSTPHGGILQLATYISGLSGGSWLLGTLYTNGFPPLTLPTFYANWNPSASPLEPAGQGISNVPGNVDAWADYVEDVKMKRDAGFEVSITDLWARLLAEYLPPNVGASSGGKKGYTPRWSQVARIPALMNASVPLPIVATVQRTEGEERVTVMANVWESTPFETGSSNVPVNSYIKTRYLGTFLDSGVATQPPPPHGGARSPSTQPCVLNFDQTSYIIGTSSSLFNLAIDSLITSHSLLSPLATLIATTGRDTALIPNPFHNLTTVNASIADPYTVELVDGGEAGQNVPLWPLLQASRANDVILAVDSSNDVAGYPNGTSLVIAAQYAAWKGLAHRFPPVPFTPEAVVAQRIHQKVTAFGCAGLARNTGGGPAGYNGPMVVYIPNRFATAPTNDSTFKMEYTFEEVRGYFANGAAAMADRSNGGWVKEANATDARTCVACILTAPLYRNGSIPTPAVCVQCLRDWCWDGSMVGEVGGVGTPVTRNYNGQGPAPVIPVDSASPSAGSRGKVVRGWGVGVGVVLGLVYGFAG
ncbi:lysophospholipase catalytic domain-containing protein [Fimicolochytrium jonesii]|uniref:lysophospholipase catalytic domain-containing protein n=1 Tax=Fimicolochytrium jonesii TaxID=1396493 RepID=UPI0022FDB613|nr:lysophospholipase catalytic domain-containing protein [Fimicolochytrium jonesii]KAI8821297.1 lysophospholipase catalytic domain-containing protein [Fimicolochytrium jonesii]